MKPIKHFFKQKFVEQFVAILLPGFLLAHIALAWFHQHQKKNSTEGALP